MIIKHHNIYWFIFLLLIGLTVFIFTLKTAFQVIHFYQLSVQLPVHEIHWTIIEKDSDHFDLEAHYAFFWENNLHSGQMLWPEAYLNRWAAEEFIERQKRKSWQVWINPNNFNDSTLQKKFPAKECLSTAILWGILLYFIGLDRYVNQKNKGKLNHDLNHTGKSKSTG